MLLDRVLVVGDGRVPGFFEDVITRVIDTAARKSV